jgi:uncharacterized DUF497 family protein
MHERGLLPRIVIYDNLSAEPTMPYYEIFWNFEDENGNVAHIAEHDLTPDDVNAVLMNPEETRVSRSSGRPIAFGYTPDGRYICVVYEEIDEFTLYPVGAFEVGD